MKKPFKMLPSRAAVLRCDGRFVIGGRAAFVWETYLLRRAAGVPGEYEIRAGDKTIWHKIVCSIEEAEAELQSYGMFGKGRVSRARKTREGRIRRGLPVG
jgi:hypothetical protein